MKVNLVSTVGRGVLDTVDVETGTTIRQLLDKYSIETGQSISVKVNFSEVDDSYVLKNGDTVSVAPSKIEGGAV